LKGANLSGADLSGVDVGAARTNGANLSGILSRPSAETIKLAIASLEQARNHHAWRRSGGKEGAAARLDGGDLCGADVTGADEGASLRGADLDTVVGLEEAYARARNFRRLMITKKGRRCAAPPLAERPPEGA
jgi:uncharacterized protein YjbI with pentapeptide repeats